MARSAGLVDEARAAGRVGWARVNEATRPHLDNAKAWSLFRMRKSNERTLGPDRADWYRHRRPPTAPMPALVPAARRHKNLNWLPTELLVPHRIPWEGWLPARYYVAYYGLAKAGFRLHRLSPIDSGRPCDHDGPWRRWFADLPDHQAPEWAALDDDQAFVQLRLQGPNPYLLRRAFDRRPGEEGAAAAFSLDFAPYFNGVFTPTEARFISDGKALRPASVTIGDRLVRPPTGDEPRADWADACRVVNGLDARYSVFVRHLLECHLLVGQAFALAAYALPAWHPLRPFASFFSYGTLAVNDAAYRSLLTADSYFLQSGFVTASDAERLIRNAMDDFDLGDWSWPDDRRRRGLDAVPGPFPYRDDADLLWPIFADEVRRHLDDLRLTDADIRGDEHLDHWFRVVCTALPGDQSGYAPTTVDDLAQLLTVMLWNNVTHEICGNLTPLLGFENPADLVKANLAGLGELASADEPPTPTARDVFLVDQAAWVSGFNVAGNSLLTIEADRHSDDPRLQRMVKRLQRDLTEADGELKGRNRERARHSVPFTNMEPSRFEASISF